jgi:hypothetical protein
MNMTLDEYRQKAEENDEWAPGWDAIDSCLKKLYGDQEPQHYGANLHDRAIFGGDQYIDGFSVYTSEHGYLHIVTYGMSELYTNEESFGGEFSKWGYEMTIKLPLSEVSEYMWAIDMLANLARYTFTSERFLEPPQYISSGGKPIKDDSGSKLTGLLVLDDTELIGIDTIHGRLDFVQLVGITQPELEAIMADPDKLPELVASLKQDNPWLVTDLARV